MRGLYAHQVRCVYPLVHLACAVNTSKATEWAASDEGQRRIKTVEERSSMHWLLGVTEKLNRDDQIAELTMVIHHSSSLELKLAAALRDSDITVPHALLSWARDLTSQPARKLDLRDV
eukprot:5954922-Pleurochrysis_carterae.AAC.1